MKKTDKNASNARRSLMTKLAELFGFRRERSLPRSEHGSRHRAAEAGNVFFTLFGAVAVVGVLGAGIMSTMRGPLTTMVEVNRIEETKAQSRMNARLILLEAASNDTHCGSTDDVTGGGSVEFTEAIPYAAGTGPTGGGVIPGGVDGAKNDPWGQAYGYCVWNNGFSNSGCANTLDGQDNLNAPAISIVSGGPDRTITTTCAQAGALNIQGDDIVETLTYSEAVSASGGLWTDSGSTIDSGKALNVTDAVNDSTFGAGASFAGDVTLATGTSVAAPSVSTDVIIPYGAGTTVSVNANTLDVNADGDISGTLTVAGATTISNTLTVTGNISDSAGNLTLDDDVDVTGALDVVGALDVSGSITDTSDNIVTVDDALSVTGAADITGNFAVNTNMFTVDATTGDTVVAGTAELNGKTIIRGDGNDDTTNAFEIWNSDVTPLELMSVDDAGNMAIAGRLLTGGFDETVSIYGTTTDGSTDPLVIYDGAATPVPVFSVNTDGEISIDGAANGDLLIATGTDFAPVAMSGDATISLAGVIDLAAGAVDNDEIADGAVDTDELADGAVTGAKIGLGVAGAGTYDCLKLDGSNIITQACGSGGGGDGVGLDGFVDLADTPSAYAGSAADADKLVVVNPTGDGLVFADASSIVPPADRLEDRVDTGNAKPVDTYIDVDTTDDGATNSIVFVTDATQRMVITETGEVAIPREQSFGTLHLGTFTPLVGVDSANALVFGSLTSNTRSRVKISGVSGEINLMTNSQNIIFSNGALNAENMRLSPSGALGLGTGASIDNSAKLQVDSTTQGFLAPRLTAAQATTLAAVPPATGLLIFNTEAGDNGIFQFWDGSAWVDVGGGGAATGGLWEPDGSNDYIEYDDTLGGVRIGRVTGQPAPATDWLLDVTNSVVYTTANKVGINSTTISPGLNLDITGNIGATNYCDQDGADCFSAADIATLAGGGGVDSDRIEDGGDANTYVDADPADDDSTNSIIFTNAGTQSIIVDASGEVGIGTMADPAFKLEVAGTTRVTNLILNTGEVVRNVADTSGITFGSNIMQLSTAATPRLYIDAAGLIGINNTTPQTQLDVTGTIRIGDGSELCNVAGHEGALRYIAASDTYQVCANSATGWEDLFSTGTGAAGLWTDIGGNRIHYGATGFERVGIATTSPITTLDVNGGVRVGSVSGNAPTYLSLNSLSNVDAPSPANNQILTFNSGSGNWEPYSSSSLVNSVVLNDLANVNVPTPSDGDVLSYDTATSRWVAVASAASADTLAGLSCSTNEVARWDGASWVCSAQTRVDATLDLQFTSTAISAGAWAQNGPSDATGETLGQAAMGLLDANTMAVLINNDTLTTYTFDGSNWSEVGGARLTVGSGIQNNIAVLDSNTIARNSGNGSAGTVRAYSWNGSTWTAGNTAPGSYYGASTMLKANTFVNIANPSSAFDIRTYTWNGSAFTLIDTYDASAEISSNVYSMERLDDQTIVLIADNMLHTYRWNGTTWSELASPFTLGFTPTVGNALVAHDSATVSIANGNSLETFYFDGATWTSAGTSAVGVAVIDGVLRDTDSMWAVEGTSNTIRRYDFSASVVGATIADTNTTGELDSILNIGDRFIVSRTSSNNKIFTVANIPDANTLQVIENAFTEGPVDTDITIISSLPNGINDIADVDADTPADNDCLLYNDTTGNWEAGSCDPSGNTLAGLSCNTNELARWNGTAWVCSTETNVDSTLSLQFTSTGVSGGSWSAVGSTSAFGHNTETYTLGIALLDSTTMAIAYKDGGANTVLTTFELSGGTWSETPGAALDLGSSQITLNMDKIANNSVMLSAGNGASGNITAYTWNGSTWSLANASAAGGYGVGAAMSNNLVAYYDNLSGNLYALSWNGSTFTTLGSINPGFSGDSFNMDQLDNNTIVIVEEGAGLTDQLHVYDWNGATWTQAGSSYTLPTEAGGYGRTFIANASNIVTIGESNNLYTYSWDGSTWTPSGTTSAIGDAAGGKMVMLDSDSAWHLGAADVIQQYDFTATIANSTIADANTTGELDTLLNIGDRFLISRTSSNNRVYTVTNIPNANTINVAENALDEGPVDADITVLTALPNALDDIFDVNVSFVTDGDCLVYNSTSEEWEPGTCDAAGNTSEWTDDGSGNIYNTDGGNVGIGTSTPSDDLHIYDSTSRGKIVIEGAASQQSIIDMLTTGDGATNIDDSAGAYGWQLYTYNNAWGNPGERNDFGLSYYNGGWQTYMYMDSATSSIGLFNASPNVALDVNGSIEYTGTLADVSDIRLKKDIKPLNTDDMIQRIMNIDTYTFVMKDDETGQVEYGVMAQEIEKIFPELVRTANDEMGTKSVNYVGLIAPMIEATKSLKAENEALKAEIAEIKTAQADILEEVKGIARHTGYGIEKGDMMYLLAAMMIMMLSGFGLALVYRRQGSGNNE